MKVEDEWGVRWVEQYWKVIALDEDKVREREDKKKDIERNINRRKKKER